MHYLKAVKREQSGRQFADLLACDGGPPSGRPGWSVPLSPSDSHSEEAVEEREDGGDEEE